SCWPGKYRGCQGCWLLTEMISPVRQEAWSLARKAMTLATSHGAAARPNAFLLASSARSSSLVTLAGNGWPARLGAKPETPGQVAGEPLADARRNCSSSWLDRTRAPQGRTRGPAGGVAGPRELRVWPAIGRRAQAQPTKHLFRRRPPGG